MPHRIGSDPALPPIFSAEQAHRAGLTKDQIRQRVRSGEWTRLARGWYQPTRGRQPSDPHEARRSAHCMAAIAACLRLPGSTICGPSAAILHGLPVSTVPAQVHLIAAPGGWTGQRSRLVVHEWPLPEDHLDIAPVRVTNVRRSWVDVARVQGPVSAVIAGDQLLRGERATVSELTDTISDMRPGHHLQRAVSALALLDGRRETPLESESACYFASCGLPSPEWQIDIRDEHGFIGRVDCAWDGTRVVGEADGRLKYTTSDDLYREKRREDRIRATGREVIRWSHADLRHLELARRIAMSLGLPTAGVTGRPLR